MIKTYMSIFTSIVAVLLVPSALLAIPIQLRWDTNAEPDIAGYKIYYGTSSKQYQESVDVGNVTSYALEDLPEGVKHYIAVTAYDINGNESSYSDEITTQNCYLGITYMSIPPFALYIFPCIDYTSYEKNFSLFRNDSRIENQTGDYIQDGQQFSALCEYSLTMFGLDIHHVWEVDGQGNASSDPVIFGDFTLGIEGKERTARGIGFFLGIKIPR